jgi:hypothetical protein
MMNITINKISYELIEPTFSVMSLALQKMLKSTGEVNLIDAGKIIFDGCYKGNSGKLEEIQKDVKLYISLCLKCAELVEVYEGELKKN